MSRGKVLQFIDGSKDPSRLVNKMPNLTDGAHQMSPEAQNFLLRFLREKMGVTGTEAAIAGGSALGLAGLGGLADVDGGEATAVGLLGAGIGAGPEMFNAVRDPKFRTQGMRRGDLVKLVAAGAGAGAGGNILIQALTGSNQ